MFGSLSALRLSAFAGEVASRLKDFFERITRVDTNTIIVEKLGEFSSTINRVASRYKIAGKLDVEDLAQECMILLAELLEKHPDLDPASADFDRYFARAIPNRIIQLVRKCYSGCRDHRREVSGNYVVGDEGGELFDFQCDESSIDPAIQVERIDSLSALCDRVEESLAPQDLQLWEMYRDDPKALWDSLQQYNAEHSSAKYQRRSHNFVTIAYHLSQAPLETRWILPGDIVHHLGRDCRVVSVSLQDDLVVVSREGTEYSVDAAALCRHWTPAQVYQRVMSLRGALVDILGAARVSSLLGVGVQRTTTGVLIGKV